MNQSNLFGRNVIKPESCLSYLTHDLTVLFTCDRVILCREKGRKEVEESRGDEREGRGEILNS